MSSEDISVTLSERETLGKGLTALREQGLIPVVIHDHGKSSIHASGEKIPLEKVISAAGRHHPVEVKVGKEDRLVLIREIDYDPGNNQIRHVVFQSIKRDQKAHAEIPIELQGDVPAEHAGLMVLRQLDTVEVEALPTDLPDIVAVDATTLKDVGDSISVADLQVPPKVTILTESSYPIATVEQPKDQIAEADAAAEALAEDAESEGIPEEDADAETGETTDESADAADEATSEDAAADSDSKD
jgi:large subunit ribosomal protein L25